MSTVTPAKTYTVTIAAEAGIPRRHSGAGPPAWMQVVERRREQAAEESSGLDKPFRPPPE